MRKFLYLWVLAAGCTKPNPALSCEDGLCSDPTVPYCDVTGSLGGEGPNTCIHVSCTPNEFAECRGDKAVTCNATGDDYDLLTCLQGCDASMGGCKPEPPCETLECKKHIIPRYAPTECDALATNGDLTVSADLALNTSDNSMCTRIVTQGTQPEICVVHYHAITIDRNKTITVTGQRALAFVADETLLVDGTVDVSASGAEDGPGGGVTFSGGTQNNTNGGGGAGYRTAGGNGANGSVDGGANNGGAMTSTPPEGLTFLIGGPRSSPPGDSYNGGGGGALTLVSCRGELSVPGLIDAGGGGGTGSDILGLNSTTFARGGGAGGTVVLQGMRVTVTGSLFSNGGGGGGNRPGNVGTPGADGTRSTSPAEGGSGTSQNGGAGGAKISPPGIGRAPYGAGGGSMGYILVYVASLAGASITPAAQSPDSSPPTVLPTN